MTLQKEDLEYLKEEKDPAIREAYAFLVKAEKEYEELKAQPVPVWGADPDPEDQDSLARYNWDKTLSRIEIDAALQACTLTLQTDGTARALLLADILLDLSDAVRELKLSAWRVSTKP